MGFLSPWFFTGLLSLGVPIFVHLLQKRVAILRPVSSLMFFERGIQSSTRYRRLHYLLLFILRSALLLLVILAFTNPFLHHSSGTRDRLLLFVLDHSFSMRAGARFEEARQQALSLLARKPKSQRAQVIALGGQLQILTQPTVDAKQLRAALEGIEPEDGRANFGELTKNISSIIAQAGESVDLHLFSDMQRTAMPSTFVDMSLPENVNLVLHNVARGSGPPNWTIENVDAPVSLHNSKNVNNLVLKAVIAGFNTPSIERTVSLLVNGKVVANDKIGIAANGRTVAEFKLPEIGYGFNRCEVRIKESDAFPEDNVSVFVIRRSDPERVLFIHSPNEIHSQLYFGTALGAASKDAFILQSVSTEEAKDINPAQYAFVVLSDTAILPSIFEHALEQYVAKGGNILISLSTGTRQHTKIPVWGSNVLEIHSYARDRGDATIGQVDFTHPALAQSQPASGNAGWEEVKIFYAAVVDPVRARVIARLSDGTPLLLDKQIGEGHVLLFTSGLENLSNDLPLHPIFIAFVDKAARYLSGNEQLSGTRTVDSVLEFRAAPARANETGVEVIDPDGRRPFSLNETHSAQSVRLHRSGFYQIRVSNGRDAVIGVNPDRRESDLEPMPQDVQQLWSGSSRYSQPQGTASFREDAKYQSPTLWWYVMLLALVVALAEFFLASNYMGVQREEV